MKNKKLFIRNTCIYVALLMGYIFLHVIDLDVLLHPEKEIVPKSKVNFIYQQF